MIRKRINTHFVTSKVSTPLTGLAVVFKDRYADIVFVGTVHGQIIDFVVGTVRPDAGKNGLICDIFGSQYYFACLCYDYYIEEAIILSQLSNGNETDFNV